MVALAPGAPFTARSAARRKVVLDAMGLLGENYARENIVGSAAGGPATQRVTYTVLGMLAGETLASLVFGVSNAGSGLTLVKAALFSVANAQLAVSAEVSASFASTGAKVVAVSPAYTPSVDVAVIAAYLAVGTTTPGLDRTAPVAVSNANGIISGGTVGRFGNQDAQADMPSTAAITWGPNGIAIWVGWK